MGKRGEKGKWKEKDGQLWENKLRVFRGLLEWRV